MERTLASRLASLVQAVHNCRDSDNTEWESRHEDEAGNLVLNYMPSGSGFDNGTTLDIDVSNGDKLVFTTSFHHMNDAGMYDDWTEHTVTVLPSFNGVNIKVSGRNRNDIKDYIAEQFVYALTQVLPDVIPAHSEG